MSLVIHAIKKAFGGFQALGGVSLTVPQGGLMGLIGPNGAGKSTLFSVISGFMPADEGSITLEGKPLDRLSAPDRAKVGMVRTFQVPREFAHLTVRENLMAAIPGQSGENLISLFLQPARVRAEEARCLDEVEEVIRFLHLQNVASLPAGKLSGGQKKLVELGRALLVRPKLILLDEPFAGVNPVLIEELMQRISDLHARGIGFLIIEHDLQALSRLVPHLAMMDQGVILAEGTPAEVLDDPRVREAYLGGVV